MYRLFSTTGSCFAGYHNVTQPNKIYIIGVGDDAIAGLTSHAKSIVETAELVIGPQSIVDSLETTAETWDPGLDPNAVLERIDSSGDTRISILTQGDPLFYGLARFLCDKLGKDRFEVIPHVSSMQLAFARVKESWDEAYLTNLATQPLVKVIERIRVSEKVGIFTTAELPPARIAQGLLDAGIDYFQSYVCENLGSPDERVTQSDLSAITDREFAELNVMILVRIPDAPDRPASMSGKRLFGNPDDLFLQSRPKHGLLTPAEVRAIALADMDIGPSSVIWDIGAGSGSVAIEAAQLARDGHAYAIEMDPEDVNLIAANAEHFNVENITPILGQAPEAWSDLPEPDAIFIGGSGRHVSSIVEKAYLRLKPHGRLLAVVGSVDGLSAVCDVLRDCNGEPEVKMISIARGVYQLEKIRLEGSNPSFIISACKR